MRQFIKFIVRNIPRPWLIRLSYLFSRIISVFYRGNQVECPVCEHTFRKFLPYGNRGNDNRLCPRCLSLERHRQLWHYLKNKTDFFVANRKMLHIAPEQPYLKTLQKMPNLNYTTADLESPIADIKLDIRAMPLPDNTYDIVFCNHVMEHIDDDHKAMTEVLRVLKPGGWAILQVPLDRRLEQTYEDFSITDPKEREKHFGQYDHVRIYGKDYPIRLQKAGFLVDEIDYVAQFSAHEQARFRFDPHERLYVCRKKNIE